MASGGVLRLMGPARSDRHALTVSLLTSGAIQALAIVTGVALARALGPTARGELAAVLLWPSVLAAVGSLGVVEATTYFAARRSELGELVSSAVVLGIAQSLLFAGAGAIVLQFALSGYEPETVRLAYLFLLFIPINLVTLYLMAILNGLYRFSSFNGLRLLVIATTAVGLMALWVAGDLTVSSAVFVYLGANLLTAVTAAAVVFRERLTLSFSRELTRDLLSFGIRSHASNVTSLLNERLDQLVISVVLAPAKLGLYVVAVTLSSAAHLIGHTVAIVALPAVARAGSDVERRDAALRFVRLTFMASIAVTIPILLLTGNLVEIFFGSSFLPAVDVARILLAASVVLAVGKALEAILKGAGRPLDAGFGGLIGLAVTAVALAALLPTLELVGAGTASLLAYGASVAWLGRRTARTLGVSTVGLLVPVGAPRTDRKP